MTMLPRRSALFRYGGGLAFLVFICYMWISTPVPSPSDIIRDLPALDKPPGREALGIETADQVNKGLKKSLAFSSPPTRLNTPPRLPPNVKSEKPPAGDAAAIHQHASANNTLEKLRKNMTLLKVNMSGFADIVHNANKSQVQSVQLWDNLNVPHPHPFKYIINSPNICKDKPIFLIIYIHTATSNYKRRMVIRQTWGNPSYYQDTLVRLVFVCGQTEEKPEVQAALQFEAEQYGDIVQENFKDTYRNLTYKGVAALKWISTHCSHAKFVLKTDDDIFVNMFTLLRHLHSLEHHGVDNHGLLMCLVWHRMKVMREGKWKVQKNEWPDDHYPTYCSGSAFTMSTDVALALHNISYHVPFFWVDDFYITGLLPLKLGTIKHKQFMSTYVLDGRKLEERFTGPQWFTYIFSHVHNLNSIQSVWDKLVQLSRGQISAKVKYALPGELRKIEAEELKKQPIKKG